MSDILTISSDIVTVTVENQIGHILLNRPNKLNALSDELFTDLIHCLKTLEKDPRVKVILLSGAGRSFSAGGDLANLSTYSGVVSSFEIMEMATPLNKTMLNLDKFIVSAVHGFAYGAGFSIALASDFIIAERNSKFACSFTNVGLVPDLGLIKQLTQRVPLPIAKEWVVTGRSISSEEALASGVINRIAETDVLEEAKDFCEFIMKGSPMSNKFAKYLFNHAGTLDWDTAIMHENMMQSLLFNTKDFKEGVAAFYEKRTPEFKGK